MTEGISSIQFYCIASELFLIYGSVFSLMMATYSRDM